MHAEVFGRSGGTTFTASRLACYNLSSAVSPQITDLGKREEGRQWGVVVDERSKKPEPPALIARIRTRLAPESLEVAPGQYIFGLEVEDTMGIETPSKEAETQTDFVPMFTFTEAENYVLMVHLRVMQEGRFDDRDYIDSLLLEGYDKETIENAIQSVMEKTGMIWDQDCPHCKKYLPNCQEANCPHCGKSLA